jgi:hypothetical protein
MIKAACSAGKKNVGRNILDLATAAAAFSMDIPLSTMA